MTPSGPSDSQGLGRLQRAFVRLVVSRNRVDEVLGDLEESFQDRTGRLGAEAARRHLRRELASLVLWRLQWWRGAAAGRDAARSAREAAGAAPATSAGVGRDVVQDLRFGIRTLLRRPAFTLTAVAVLGLGIGAPATVLTLVSRMFLHPPAHIQDPGRLVRLTRSFGEGQGGGALGNPDYLYYRENNSTLSGLAASGEFRAVAYATGEGRSDQLDVLFVSDNFFDVLGVVPARGRTFRPQENATPGTHPVAIVSHGLWKGPLGGDPGVLDRTLTLAGRPYRVVGVAPEGFEGVSPTGPFPDVWVPIAMYGELTRAGSEDWWQRLPHSRSRWLQGLGRLAPGVTFEAARSNLVALGEALEYEGKSEDEGAFLQSQFLYSPRLEGTLTSLTRMLLAVVAIVFVVALFNVAVLLLSRAAYRRHEMGIRTALGAGSGRIVRQVLAETLLLAVAGGGLGLLLAFLFSGLAASLLPVRFAAEFRPDLPVTLTAAGLSLLTAAAAGLVPALRLARRDPRGTLAGRGETFSESRLQHLLIVGQVALSLVLVAGAFLFGRSLWEARSQELGFETTDRLVLQVGLTELDYERDRTVSLVETSLDRIRNLPGIEAVAATRMIPFQGDWSTEFDVPPGAQPNQGEGLVFTGLNAVSPGYFRVAGVPIVRGRGFEAGDSEGAPLVAVVNETLAQAMWPGEDPLGRAVPIDDERTLTVVGVARAATYYALGEEPQPQVFLSLDQFPQRSVHFLVHTGGPPTEWITPVQDALREIEPRLVFRWVTSMASVFEEEIARYEVSAILVAIFGAIALLLASAGLYGTISFLVARRTREIGVRMALGAGRSRVAGEILRFGLKLALAGAALGLVGAVVLRRLAEGLLFQVEPTDPLPLAAAGVVLLAVALLASLAPARHATRVDPMEAIRTE